MAEVEREKLTAGQIAAFFAEMGLATQEDRQRYRDLEACGPGEPIVDPVAFWTAKDTGEEN